MQLINEKIGQLNYLFLVCCEVLFFSCASMQASLNELLKCILSSASDLSNQHSNQPAVPIKTLGSSFAEIFKAKWKYACLWN